jgi:ligand of Numb protein X 1/2
LFLSHRKKQTLALVRYTSVYKRKANLQWKSNIWVYRICATWFRMGTTNDEMASVEQTSSYSSLNPLCFECGQQHWTKENHLYNYQDEVDDDLVCHICLQPLLQPLDTPCGHTFCYKCLRNFLQEKDFCPLDRKRLHFKLCKKSSILVHKLLDKLLVLCPFSSVCQDVMQRCDLEAHLKNR